MKFNLKKFRGIWGSMALFFFFALTICAFAQDESGSEDPDYIREIEEHYGIIVDPEIVRLVESIRERLVDAVPEDRRGGKEIKVKVLNDESVN
ncbi:MAG TPA: hypothetical protein ENN67_05440, partial [Firmicutes bacterium]|nr:hypothetical protein [Bacillota bacterium]